jgi:hypothetical protein
MRKQNIWETSLEYLITPDSFLFYANSILRKYMRVINKAIYKPAPDYKLYEQAFIQAAYDKKSLPQICRELKLNPSQARPTLKKLWPDVYKAFVENGKERQRTK